MPRITPLATAPTTRPDGVAAASLLQLPPGRLLWVDGRVTAGTVSARPYYWSDEPASAASIKGAWMPLGFDAVAGAASVSFAAASKDGCAVGRYEVRRAPAYWVFVQEAAAGVTWDFAHLSTED